MCRIEAIYHSFYFIGFSVGTRWEENRRRELGAGAQIEKNKQNFPGLAKHHRHQSEDIVCEEQWLPSQSRSLCVVAHLRSQNPPLTGKITGLSNQQMQTAENNIMGSPQRGILRGPPGRDAQITSNKESRKLHTLILWHVKKRIITKLSFKSNFIQSTFDSTII